MNNKSKEEVILELWWVLGVSLAVILLIALPVLVALAGMWSAGWRP